MRGGSLAPKVLIYPDKVVDSGGFTWNDRIR
jgi:hypothetical protein